jgi:hypothetical protein
VRVTIGSSRGRTRMATSRRPDSSNIKVLGCLAASSSEPGQHYVIPPGLNAILECPE